MYFIITLLKSLEPFVIRVIYRDDVEVYNYRVTTQQYGLRTDTVRELILLYRDIALSLPFTEVGTQIYNVFGSMFHITCDTNIPNNIIWDT